MNKKSRQLLGLCGLACRFFALVQISFFEYLPESGIRMVIRDRPRVAGIISCVEGKK